MTRSGSSLASVLLALPLPCAPALGQAIRLNAPLPPGADVWGFEVAPDGRHVVYTADQRVAGVIELFSVVPGPNAVPVRVSGDLVAGGGVVWNYSFHVTPDAKRVVYEAYQDSVDVRELYSAPIDGAAPAVKLNGPLGPNGNVTNEWTSPDGRHVVYRADPTLDERFELFSVSVDGSAPPVRLCTDPVAGGAVQEAVISPDARRVVYRADRDVDDQFELYSVPIDGSAAPVELNAPLPAGGDVFVCRFRPDSGALVYTARQEAADRVDVYVVPVDGSAAAVRVSGPTLADTRVGSAVTFTHDGLRVIYGTNRGDLYTVPADGSIPAAPLSTEWAVAVGFAFSSDGQRVLYVGRTAPTRGSLFVAPIDGSSPAIRLTAQEDVNAFVVSSAGLSLFRAHDELGSEALFSVPIDGSASPVRLTPPELRPLSFIVTTDGLGAIFHAPIGVGVPIVLYSAPLDGSRGPTQLAGEPRNHVGEVALVPGGDRIVFKDGQLPQLDSFPNQLFLTWLPKEETSRTRVR